MVAAVEQATGDYRALHASCASYAFQWNALAARPAAKRQQALSEVFKKTQLPSLAAGLDEASDSSPSPVAPNQ